MCTEKRQEQYREQSREEKRRNVDETKKMRHTVAFPAAVIVMDYCDSQYRGERLNKQGKKGTEKKCRE